VVTGAIRPSLRLQAELSSTNENVSPIIDMQKITTYVVKNLVNDVQEFDINVNEIDKRILLDNTITSSLTFANATSTTCTILTDDDAADNLLSTITPGKFIQIENASIDLNGTGPVGTSTGKYHVKSVVVSSDTVDSGDAEGDKVLVTLSGQFNATGTIATNSQGSTFAISVLDKFLSDNAAVGCSNAANYVTRALSLSSPADSFKIIFDANLPEGTTLNVLYKTWSNPVELNNVQYESTEFSKSTSDARDVFSERMITIENIALFKNIIVKLVLKSNHPVYVPKLKNLRVVAYS
jgi:hypothetical protein